MSAASQDSESSQSSSGYEDGLGRRVLAFDRETGEMLERLVLRPELSAFEAPLRERITIVAELEDERFARPRGIERDAHDRLTVVSEYVAGRRLSDVLDAAAEHGIVAGLDAGLGLLLELLPAIARLHDAGLAHGALAAGRVLITPAGQLVLLDAIYADPLERLKLTRRRLWSELRLVFPPTAGVARFDKSADLGHAAMIAAALSVGRPLRDDDYPDGIPALRQEIVEIAAIRGSKAFATGVDKVFAGALPLAGRRAAISADEAAIDLRKLVRKELGITTCRNALLEFFQQVEAAEAERIAGDARRAQVETEQVAARQTADAARLEAERAEAERIARERAEAARADAERVEKERQEKARLGAERVEKERREQARLEAERIEKERIAAEQARVEAERLEKERREKARLEAERLEKERQEKARLEAERIERERIAAEKARLEAERLEKERQEKARLEAERIERERIAAEKARLEAERIEKERQEKERQEKARLEAERLEKERQEKARLEAERLEKERREKARLEAERLERERIEKERQEKARLEAERLEKERQEKARLEAERIERERIAAEEARLEKERLERERAEKARLEAERLERERLETERRERVARERAEKARLEAERAEKARLEAERLAEEHAAAERRERELLEAARAERERAEKARQEAERLEQERVEHARLAAEREEQEEERERAERARIEAERVAAEEQERARARERERERDEAAARAIARDTVVPPKVKDVDEPEAPAAAAGWLIPPDRAAKFDQPIAEAPPPAPTARLYPIYVPPAEPESWTPDMPLSASEPKQHAVKGVTQGLAAPPPPSTPDMPTPKAEQIRVKTDAGGGVISSRPPSERHEPVSISAAGAYDPKVRQKPPQPIPWKLIAAGVVLIAATTAIRLGYTPSDAPIMQVVRKVTPAPATKATPPPAVTGNAGRLTITTQPAGARVSIDGKAAGETPLTLDTVKPGRHVVTLVSPSGTTVKRNVRVEAGRTLAIDVPLFAGFARISAPFVIEISEDGKALGTSDEQIILPPGSHSLRLANKELGYVATETLEIQPGEVTRISVDPRGRANINAVPWAEVWIDGEKAGETPLANVPVRLGVREFVFKNPRFGERKIVTTVTATSPASVSVDFTR